MSSQPRTPATMRIRVPVRRLLRSVATAAQLDSAEACTSVGEDRTPLVLVALSGGADSLALAAAVAAEASAAGVRAGAVVVDHGLQDGSAEVAARAAEQARGIGLAPVLVRRVTVPGGADVSPVEGVDAPVSPNICHKVRVTASVKQTLGQVFSEGNGGSEGSRAGRGHEGSGSGRGYWASRGHGVSADSGVGRVGRRDNGSSSIGGPEAAARTARYEALAKAAAELGAVAVLTAHTRDDQAEQVLLALARGSGTRSIAGIPPVRMLARGILVFRPLLDEQAGVTRKVTEASCAELGLDSWQDPHNLDRSFARVRVRADALPLLEEQLGHGFTAALARSADLAREDADALDALAEQHFAAIVQRSNEGDEDRQVFMSVPALQALPPALRGRVIRIVADREFNSQLSREHTLAIASLVTAWKGQGPIHAPRIIVRREAGNIVVCAR